MKKFTSLLICTLIIMTSLCVIASATDNTNTYYANGNEYTVEFENSTISDEKKDSLANALIGNDESEIMTANILCDIFGHDLKSTTASVIEHKAKQYAPRCQRFLYSVTYCEDCDYSEQQLISTLYINCCPED